MLPDMGNRSRRRRRADGTISQGRAVQPAPLAGSRNDPLYGIPDTNMPGLANIRLARALQGRGGWRRTFAWSWLVLILVVTLLTSLQLILR